MAERAPYYVRFTVSPDDADLLYFVSVRFSVSKDGGATLESGFRAGRADITEVTPLLSDDDEDVEAFLALDAADLKLSVRNRLRGTVSRLTPGAVNSEVIVTLAGGNTVCAIVTNDSMEQMALAEGSPVVVLFQASSVILGVAA